MLGMGPLEKKSRGRPVRSGRVSRFSFFFLSILLVQHTRQSVDIDRVGEEYDWGRSGYTSIRVQQKERAVCVYVVICYCVWVLCFFFEGEGIA